MPGRRMLVVEAHSGDFVWRTASGAPCQLSGAVTSAALHSAMRIGRGHIASTIYTIAFA